MTSVHFIVPTRATVRVELAQMREYLAITDRRYNLTLGYSDAQPIANNRNRITRRFLESDGDYLLMIDSDTVPLFNPLDYVELDKDILGFPYPTWRANADKPLLWFPAEPEPGLKQVEEIGGGAILIARRVLEHKEMRAPFMDNWDDDGQRTEAEDQTFCLRAKNAGFEVWCQMDAVCAHFKTVDVYTLWRTYGQD